MTAALGVSAIADYLRGTGWQLRPLQWRGASIWTRDGADVLVPARDGMGDGDLRVREILDVLAAVEDRAPGEIAQDIGSSPADTQRFRFLTPLSGFTTLRHALSAVARIGGAFRAVSNAVLGDPSSGGEGSAAVDRFMAGIQVGTGRPGSYIVPVRVPLGESDGSGMPLGRLVTQRLHGAVSVLSDPAAEPKADPGGAPLSADLCDVLGALSDESEERSFEIGFGWSRTLPADLPPAVYRFEPGAGDRLRATATRLRLLETLADDVVSLPEVPAVVTVTGLIPRLDRDHWAIDVSADTPLAGTARRKLHVRLPDRRTYESAIVAHYEQRRVQVRGAVILHSRRTELHVTDPTGFTVLDIDSRGAS
ncbi:MAG TPA: hypothetical protein VGH57_18660 [Amycolatopsis sp.]|jgi:hypothetical protein